MYAIVWRFVVKNRADFEGHYGPAKELRPRVRRIAPEERRPRSLAFLAFRARNLAEYEAIDRRFEALTESETRIGEFATVG